MPMLPKDKSLSRLACKLCGACLRDVQKEGCFAIYPDNRASCRQDGWEQILKGECNDDAPRPLSR